MPAGQAPSPAPADFASRAAAASLPSSAVPAQFPAEARLMARVRARCQTELAAACRFSSVPPEFLAALVANESGADPAAQRFEPAVYRHLRALADGHSPRYGAITPASLEDEVAEILRPKAASYHAAQLDAAFALARAAEVATLRDEALREISTSWGYTQIMGYHMVGRAGTPRDLLDPGLHFRVALELLAQFSERFQLDPRREFAELFRCWNAGRPDGETTDRDYVAKGLRRLELYRAITPPTDVAYG